MGIVLSRVFQALFGSKEVRILILGLDNAGKTTILYRLQNEADDNIQTIPTIGFNVETLQYKNIKFQVRWVGAWCWCWLRASKAKVFLASPMAVLLGLAVVVSIFFRISIPFST